MVNWTHTTGQTQGGIATVQVKVCGITEEIGLDCCLELGVDYLGFNFVRSSRRFVDLERARRLAERAGGKCRLVGVFMDPSREEILRVLEKVPLDAIQLHGRETPEFCNSLPIPVWKVFAVGVGWSAADLSHYPDVAVHLFDTASHNGVSGGTGRVFDWSLLPSHIDHPWFLAGGLTPENLAGAITLCRPDGVDLNSGVESAPGIKDPVRLRAAMAIISTLRSQPVGVGLPGRPSPNVEVDGTLWPCWKFDAHRVDPEVELRGLMGLLEVHDHLVLDLSARDGRATEMASELIQWQMLAKQRGHHVKFRISESTMEGLVRLSIGNLLEIVD